MNPEIAFVVHKIAAKKTLASGRCEVEIHGRPCKDISVGHILYSNFISFSGTTILIKAYNKSLDTINSGITCAIYILCDTTPDEVPEYLYLNDTTFQNLVSNKL